MNRVFVLSKTGKTLMPCHPARARQLLHDKKAVIKRHYPFTIQLTHRSEEYIQPVELKFDPGSKQTGIGIVLHGKNRLSAIYGAVLTHRGNEIKNNLDSRRMIRRSRRNRKTRYRQVRFLNRVRSKHKGWLAPSVQSRVDNIVEWSKRFIRYVTVGFITVESVKFDMQKMENADVDGIEYQRGTLFDYEVKEYLLEKYNYSCVYCGAKNVPFEKEHVIPRSRGGSNRISNLVLSCRSCNEKKDNLPIEEYLKDNPALLKKIKAQLKSSLKDAAAVNITRKQIVKELENLNVPVLTGTGAETKYNRVSQGYKKEHYIDALCAGTTGTKVYIPSTLKPLLIKKERRNNRQMCLVDKYGFPRGKAKGSKIVHGFKTGDIVKAVVLKGKKKGTYKGKVAVRSSGSFNIKVKQGVVEGIGWKNCVMLYRFDGYSYAY